MKKILCLVLTFSMVFSLGIVVFGATDKTISEPLNVVPGGQGVGFYDNAGTGTSPEVYSGDLMLRFAEWTKYDVADLEDGTYKVTINTASTSGTYVAVFANDTLLAKKTVPANGGTYATFVSTELGNVYLSGSARTITIKNCGLLNAMVVKSITLSRISTYNLNPPLVIQAQNVISTTAGSGYYDAGGSTFAQVISGVNLIQHSSDWSKYDISGLQAGMYAIKAYIATNGATEHKIDINDGALTMTSPSIPTTGGYAKFQEVNLGTMNIPEGALTIKATSGVNSRYVQYFQLERIYPFGYVSTVDNLNINIDHGVSRGVDSFSVGFNNAMQSSTINKTNVTIKEKPDRVLDYDVSLDETGKNINIVLKETLDYSSDYEININSISDVYAQPLSRGVKFDFTTLNEVSDNGSANVSDVILSKNYNEITITGKMMNSKGVGIKGRNTSLDVKAPNGSRQQNVATDVSGDGGAFTLSYAIPEGSDSGKYDVYVGGEYIPTQSYAHQEAFYYNAELDAEISMNMSNIATVQEVKTVLGQYAQLIGIDLANISSQIANTDYVYSMLTNKVFISVEKLVNDLDKAVAFEKINQALTVGDVKNVFEDSISCGLLTIDQNKLNLLTEDDVTKNKTVLYQSIFNSKRYVSIEAFNNKVDEKISDLLKSQSKITAPNLIALGKTITVGQACDINVKFDTLQNDIKGIHLELSYNEEDSGIVFNTLGSAVTTLKNANIVTTKQSNKILIDIALPAILDRVSDICTMNFTAPTDSKGTHTLTIGGYALYEPIASDPYVLKQDVVAAITSSVIVNANSNGNHNYQGGSGGGGGSSYTTVPTQPEISTDPTIPESVFNDLGDVEWARESILALAKKNIIVGKAENKFAPKDLVTRAEFSKMMVLAFELLKDDAKCKFNDVTQNDWYYKYVASAVAANLINGTYDGNFYPNESLTREDMCVMAYRLSKLKDKGVHEKVMDKFSDEGEISDYALSSVNAMRNIGVVNGVDNNMFSPKEQVNRSMAAKVINEIIKLVNGSL